MDGMHPAALASNKASITPSIRCCGRMPLAQKPQKRGAFAVVDLSFTVVDSSFTAVELSFTVLVPVLGPGMKRLPCRGVRRMVGDTCHRLQSSQIAHLMLGKETFHSVVDVSTIALPAFQVELCLDAHRIVAEDGFIFWVWLFFALAHCWCDHRCTKYFTRRYKTVVARAAVVVVATTVVIVAAVTEVATVTIVAVIVVAPIVAEVGGRSEP